MLCLQVNKMFSFFCIRTLGVGLCDGNQNVSVRVAYVMMRCFNLHFHNFLLFAIRDFSVPTAYWSAHLKNPFQLVTRAEHVRGKKKL